MKNIIKNYLNIFSKEHRTRKRALTIFLIMAMCVSTGVIWRLKLTGISMSNEVYCGLEEHVHSDECYEMVLICGYDEDGNPVETPALPDENVPEETNPDVPEPAPEVSTVSDETAPGMAAASNEAEVKYVCGLEEHTHGEECFEIVKTLNCPAEEHTHSEACYNEAGELICGLEEHVHTDECYIEEKVCICQIPEHVHSAECIAPEEPEPAPAAETEPQPTPAPEGEAPQPTPAPEGEAPQPTPAAEGETPQPTPTPEGNEDKQPAGKHVHTESCYKKVLVCDKKEHKHTIECMSNKEADLETAEIWEATLPALSGIGSDDIAAIAMSQLGYTESTANFELAEDGETRRGYSRYGQWGGNPYGQWDAMFVSFCISYAHVNAPLNSGCTGLWAAWNNAGMLKAPAEYDPKIGDIAFIDFYADGTADVSAVISAVNEGGLNIIVGDYNDKVELLSCTEDMIIAYGVIPTTEAPVPEESENTDEPQDPNAEPDLENMDENALLEYFNEKLSALENKLTEIINANTETETESVPESEPEHEAEPIPQPKAEENAAPRPAVMSLAVTPEEVNEAEAYLGEVSAFTVISSGVITEPETDPQLQALDDENKGLNNKIDLLYSENKISEESYNSLSGRSADLNRRIQSYKAPEPKAGPQELKAYLKNNGGSVSVIILNKDQTEIQPDSQGRLPVKPKKDYSLTLQIMAPNGIKPGDYYYQLPAELQYLAGGGDIVIDGVKLGTWSLDSKGLINFHFDQASNKVTDLVISASSTVKFNAGGGEIVFDGGVKVVVEEKEEKPEVHVTKKGIGIDENGNPVPKNEKNKPYSQIKWTVTVTAKNGGVIVGKEMKDIIQSTGYLEYTQKDKDAGIKFTVTDDKGTADKSDDEVYTWTAYDPDVKWTKSGKNKNREWVYTIPQTVVTDKGEVTLTDDMKIVAEYYTSTKNNKANAIYSYKNLASVGEVNGQGNTNQVVGTASGTIVKEGKFSDDYKSVSYTITASIPQYVPEIKNKTFGWQIYEQPHIKGGRKLDHVLTPENITMVLKYGGAEYPVQYWDGSSAIGSEYGWTFGKTDSSGKHIHLFSRCNCTKNNCGNWNGSCKATKIPTNNGSKNLPSGYCSCWTLQEPADLEIKLSFDTTKIVIENQNKSLENDVTLFHSEISSTGEELTLKDAIASDSDKIKSIFNKTEENKANAENGYKATYRLTINEAMKQLTENNEPMVIKDQMSANATYVPGSMVVRAFVPKPDGKPGFEKNLEIYKDYTINNDYQNHRLDITINEPGSKMYIIDYNAQVNVLTDAGGTYSNSAVITLWGREIKDETKSIQPDINAKGSTYEVHLTKYEAGNDVKLVPGAKYRLFTADTHEGVDIQTTDQNGELSFKTDLNAGVILVEHKPYYIQEIESPPGYKLNPEKYYIFFAAPNEHDGGDCVKCDEIEQMYAAQKIVKIPYGTVGQVSAYDSLMDYSLPETGGIGIGAYTGGGAALLGIGTYLLARRNKKKKGGKSE